MIKVTVDVQKAIGRLTNFKNFGYPHAAKKSADSGAEELEGRARERLSKTVAMPTNELYDNIKRELLPNPKFNYGGTTELARTRANTEYAQLIEEGSNAFAGGGIFVPYDTKIANWWSLMGFGTYPESGKVLHHSGGTGKGQWYMRFSIPYAEQVYLIEARKNMMEAARNV